MFRTMKAEETVLHVHAWTKVLTSAIFKAAADCGVRIILSVHDYFLSCPNGGCYNFVQGKICTLQPMSFGCVACNCDSRNYVYKIWRCLRQQKQNRVLRFAMAVSIISYLILLVYELVHGGLLLAPVYVLKDPEKVAMLTPEQAEHEMQLGKLAEDADTAEREQRLSAWLMERGW